MSLRSGKRRWRSEGTRKFRKGCFRARERSTPLRKGTFWPWSRPGEETTTRLTTSEGTQRSSWQASNSLCSTKNTMISLSNSTTKPRRLRQTPRWSTKSQSTRKALFTITTFSPNRRRRNRKNGRSKILPRQAGKAKKMTWWEGADRPRHPSCPAVWVSEQVLPRVPVRRGRWCMRRCNQRNRWSRRSTVVATARTTTCCKTQVFSVTRTFRSWYWSRGEASIQVSRRMNHFLEISMGDGVCFCYAWKSVLEHEVLISCPKSVPE